ncbi:MAG: chorismate synthase [Nitrospirota bacterium]
MRLRFLTSGESHGQALVGVLEGVPAGLELAREHIDRELGRRQGGHGRGGRMKIESDTARILSGVRWGRTLGSPIALLIENRDWANWREAMSPEAEHAGSIAPVTRPRPGHADLAGALKYGHRDIRNVLERSSARETAMRVALGAVAKRLLWELGAAVGSYVLSIGPVAWSPPREVPEECLALHEKAEVSPVRCPDPKAGKRMVAAIDAAAKEGDSLGGVFEVFALGLPPGLGSHVHWDRRLDGRLAQALMSIQAIKGVEAGLGFEAARRKGSEAMDEILPPKEGQPLPARGSNNAGGIEGGITNGMPLLMRAAMKPIPTLRRPLRSVDLKTGEPVEAAYERSDVCAVPAASVIGEAMAALTLADAFLEKLGGDSLEETRRNLASYMESLEARS